ncbi:response regulator [Nitrospinota bacterium]
MTPAELIRESPAILLVEENPDDAKLVIRSFKKQRVANMVHHVTGGGEALDYLFRQGAYADPEKSPRPHMILLDLRLPRMDGLEVLKVIKSSDELASIPVVVLSTSASERDATQAYEDSENSYVVKPLDSQTFTQLMDGLGYYWLAWNFVPWRNGPERPETGPA